MEECHLAMSIQIQPNVAEIPKPLGRIVSNGSGGLGGVSERGGLSRPFEELVMVCANPGWDPPPSHEHRPASMIEAADRRGIRGLYFTCPPPLSRVFSQPTASGCKREWSKGRADMHERTPGQRTWSTWLPMAADFLCGLLT